MLRRVYVHCTAGLGRAPAVCIAYVHWFGEHHGVGALDLDDGIPDTPKHRQSSGHV